MTDSDNFGNTSLIVKFLRDASKELNHTTLILKRKDVRCVFSIHSIGYGRRIKLQMIKNERENRPYLLLPIGSQIIYSYR